MPPPLQGTFSGASSDLVVSEKQSKDLFAFVISFLEPDRL